MRGPFHRVVIIMYEYMHITCIEYDYMKYYAENMHRVHVDQVYAYYMAQSVVIRLCILYAFIEDIIAHAGVIS